MKAKCPAYGKTCNCCKEANHFAVCCGKATGNKPLGQGQVRSFNDDNDYAAEGQPYEEISMLSTHSRTVTAENYLQPQKIICNYVYQQHRR